MLVPGVGCVLSHRSGAHAEREDRREIPWQTGSVLSSLSGPLASFESHYRWTLEILQEAHAGARESESSFRRARLHLAERVQRVDFSQS